MTHKIIVYATKITNYINKLINIRGSRTSFYFDIFLETSVQFIDAFLKFSTHDVAHVSLVSF